MLEKLIERRITDYVKRQGGWVTKIHASAEQGKGTLDLLGSVHGQPFYVDVKRSDGGKVSKMQQHLIHRAQKTGFVSGAVASLEEFIDLFSK